MLPKYKDIVDLIKKGSTLEAQEKIMELREAAIQLQDENHELRDKVKTLEEKIRIKDSLVFERPYYWLEVENEEGTYDRDGPYCQLCYDRDKALIRLQGGHNGQWRCRSCKSPYYDNTYKPPARQISEGITPGSHSWMGR